jgi:hypothetical protein
MKMTVCRDIALCTLTDVSEALAASIFIVVNISETLVNFYATTRRNILGGCHLRRPWCLSTDTTYRLNFILVRADPKTHALHFTEIEHLRFLKTKAPHKQIYNTQININA